MPIADTLLFEQPALRHMLLPSTLPVLWESDDPLTHVLDGFYIPDAELDADGLFFFDNETHPIAFDYYFFSIPRMRDMLSLWPFIDLSFTPGSVHVETNCNYSRNNRLRQAWQANFGLLRFATTHLTCPLVPLYFITFRLVGIGYFCEYLDSTTIRLIVSNTHDVLLCMPNGVFASSLKLENTNEATLFFMYSTDYALLQAFAAKIHSLVPFNVYEYKGVLFDGEKRRKRITKQKQK